MHSTTTVRSGHRPRSTAIFALIVWFVLTMLVMLGIASTGFSDFRVQLVPTPRYAYCTKEWRQQHLPLDLQAQFADWCEQRPGR